METTDHFGEVPVAQAGLDLPLGEDTPLEHQDPGAFDQGRGGNAQGVRFGVEDDLDVRRGAGQQTRGELRVVEDDFDLDGAILLLEVEDIGSHPVHAAGEVPIPVRVDSYPDQLAGGDPGRVDLVHRSADVDAGRIQDVDHRRHR